MATTYRTIPLDEYDPATAACVTWHTMTRTKRGRTVESTYVLAHADRNCPDALPGGFDCDGPAGAGEDEPWPCSTCYVWTPGVDAAPNGDRRDSIDAPDRHGDAGPTRGEEPATPAQVRLLTALVRQQRLDANPDAPAAQIEQLVADAVDAVAGSKRRTSAAIDAAKGAGIVPRWTSLVEHDPRTATADPVARTEGLRRNRYAAKCAACGAQVPAEGGWLTKGASGWEVRHEGECPAPAAAPVEPTVDVPAGYYAIDSTGDNDLAFYRVDRPTEGDYAGRVFVKMVVGGKPDANVRRAAVAGILARIAEAGVAEAAKRYADEIGRCSRCNRHLTDQESRRYGMGPECRTRGL